MKKFKYYSIRDKSKEIVGIVEAKNTSDAISKAAKKKDLGWGHLVYGIILHILWKYPSILSPICRTVLESRQPNPYSCPRHSH